MCRPIVLTVILSAGCMQTATTPPKLTPVAQGNPAEKRIDPPAMKADPLPPGVIHVHDVELAVEERENNRAIKGKPFDGNTVKVIGRFHHAGSGRLVVLEDVRKDYDISSLAFTASVEDWKIIAGFKPGDILTVEGVVSSHRPTTALMSAGLTKPKLVTPQQPELRGRPSEAP